VGGCERAAAALRNARESLAPTGRLIVDVERRAGGLIKTELEPFTLPWYGLSEFSAMLAGLCGDPRCVSNSKRDLFFIPERSVVLLHQNGATPACRYARMVSGTTGNVCPVRACHLAKCRARAAVAGHRGAGAAGRRAMALR
jgi:hypothetical protein